MAAPKSQYKAGYDEGEKEGREKGRREILSLLEERYMQPDVERNTPMAQAILKIAREMSLILAGKVVPK